MMSTVEVTREYITLTITPASGDTLEEKILHEFLAVSGDSDQLRVRSSNNSRSIEVSVWRSKC